MYLMPDKNFPNIEKPVHTFQRALIVWLRWHWGNKIILKIGRCAWLYTIIELKYFGSLGNTLFLIKIF